MQKPRVECHTSGVTCALRIPVLPHPGEGDVVADADADDSEAEETGHTQYPVQVGMRVAELMYKLRTLEELREVVSLASAFC